MKTSVLLAEYYGLADLGQYAGKVKAGDVIPVPLFPIGNWKSAKYPELPLTRSLADELIANFDAGVLGETEPVIDSSGTHNQQAPASAWTKRLEIVKTNDGGELLVAHSQLTDVGADDLNNQRFRYASVEIGPYVRNDTGEKVANVYKGATFTNTPVLRIMPSVLDTPEAIAASEICFALSEIEAADDDPVLAILDDMDTLASKLDDALKGKKGMPAIRTMLREIRTKANVHKQLADSANDQRRNLESAIEEQIGRGVWVEDFNAADGWVVFTTYGDGVIPSITRRAVYTSTGTTITIGAAIEVEPRTTYVPVQAPTGLSPMGGTTGEAIAGSASAEGVGPSIQPGKEQKQMSELTQLLKLSEGADEPTVLAEVKKVVTERDVAVGKLSERDKADRVRRLDEAITATEVLPREKDRLVKLAETHPDAFDAELADRKGGKQIDTTEHGSGAPGKATDVYPNASVELAEKAKARAKKDSIEYSAASRLVLSEEPDLAERYDDYRFDPDRKGA